VPEPASPPIKTWFSSWFGPNTPHARPRMPQRYDKYQLFSSPQLGSESRALVPSFDDSDVQVVILYGPRYRLVSIDDHLDRKWRSLFKLFYIWLKQVYARVRTRPNRDFIFLFK